jgi:hypothetical protein
MDSLTQLPNKNTQLHLGRVFAIAEFC